MVLVAKLSPKTSAKRETDKTAAEAVVKELRQNGFPAYCYLEESKEPAENKQPDVLIFAGNYPSAGHTVARRTLAWIRTFQPKNSTIQEFRATDGRPHPFVEATLVRNPFLAEDN